MRSAEEILKDCGFSSSEIQTVLKGGLVKNVATSSHERELGLHFAFFIKQSVNETQQNLASSERVRVKENDPAVQALRFIDLEEPNFDEVTLDDSTLPLYKSAKEGSDLNLSHDEIAAFKSCKTDEDIQQKFRDVLLGRFNAYREAGLKGILPYARGKKKDFYPGDELKTTVGKMSLLKKEAPEFHDIVLNYPSRKPEGLDERFFWTKSDMEGKNTFALIHQMGFLKDDVYVLMERHYYVSRGHNSVQGIGGVFQAEGGSVIAYTPRTSTDQVAGFGGAAKRSIGARIMGSNIARNFEALREEIAKDNK